MDTLLDYNFRINKIFMENWWVNQSKIDNLMILIYKTLTI